MIELTYGPVHTTYLCRDPITIRSLRQYLTVPNPDWRQGAPEDVPRVFELLDEDRRILPTGLVAKVVWWLLSERRLERDAVRLIDFPQETPHKVDPKIVPGYTLKPFQIAVAEACISQLRGVLEAATGAGKTEIAKAIILTLDRPRTLFLCPDTTAVREMYRRFLEHGAFREEELGRIGDDDFEPEAQIVIATVAGVFSGVKRGYPEILALLREAVLLFVDECFPATVCVGERRIGDIKVGDVVPSFDVTTGCKVWRKVTHIFKRSARRLLRVRVGVRSVVCTPNHPFLTRRGWVAAGALVAGDFLYDDSSMRSMSEANHQEGAFREESAVLLRGLQGASTDRAGDTDRAVPSVRKSAVLARVPRPTTHCAGVYILPRSVYGATDGGRAPSSGPPYGLYESQGCVAADAYTKPYEAPGDSCQVVGDPTAYRTSSPVDGRQGARSDGSADALVQCPWEWMGDRVSVDDGQAQRSAGVCLSGSRSPSEQDRYRGGRAVALRSEDAGRRPTQGGVLAWVRVDGVEVLESGSDGTFGGLCPDGLVYNLEVEGTHTYFADGFVVHNCHHVKAFSWTTVLAACSAERRIALSGTPYNNPRSRYDLRLVDGNDALLQAMTGPTLVSVHATFLQSIGHLSDFEVVPIPVPGEAISSWDWDTVYTKGVVRNTGRTRCLSLVAANLVDQGFRPLISIEKLEHGRRFQHELRALGIPALCAFGQGVFIVPEELVSLLPPDITTVHIEVPKKHAEYVVGTFRDKRIIYEEHFVQLVADDVSALEERLFRLFLSGAVGVLIGSRIFNEVVNLPYVTDIINAAGYKKSQQLRQKYGRALRNFAGKSCARAWEPYDTAHAHLERHSQQRLDIARKEGFRISSRLPVEGWVRFRDLRPLLTFKVGEDAMRIREVEITASLSLSYSVGGQTITIAPRATLRAELKEGEDAKIAAEALGNQAIGVLLHEATAQAFWGSQFLHLGPTDAIAAHARAVADAKKAAEAQPPR